MKMWTCAVVTTDVFSDERLRSSCRDVLVASCDGRRRSMGVNIATRACLCTDTLPVTRRQKIAQAS